MICQECGNRPATLHFTKIVNGQKTEFHICDVCAKERGELIPGTHNAFSIHSLLSGLLNYEPVGATMTQPLRCKTCGLTYNQFSQSGRFGCSDCYNSFKGQLDPIFKRIHGNTVHGGKIPQRAGAEINMRRRLKDLKTKLSLSVEREEFEEAARLRDEIRKLEQLIGENE